MSIPHRHSRPANIAASERTFFITASTWEKRNLLQSSRTAEPFFRTIQDYRAQRKFLLHEFVVMPNHVHLLVTVDIDMTIERAVQLIKGGFSFQAGKPLGIQAPFWQKGFSEVRVLHSDGFENHRRYIHNNPVKAHFGWEGRRVSILVSEPNIGPRPHARTAQAGLFGTVVRSSRSLRRGKAIQSCAGA